MRRVAKAVGDVFAGVVLGVAYFIVVRNIRKKRAAANAAPEGELVVLRNAPKEREQ